MSQLPENVELLRTRVIVERDRVTSVSGSDYPHQYPGLNLEWNLEQFKKNFKLKINQVTDTDIEFDLVGVDASIANAFRRILIAEVPTMAIEKVYIMNNTSIIQDEVLAHRLGLIPIKADPQHFEYKSDEEGPTDLNTIVFKLKKKCERNPDASPDETDPAVKYINSAVYSGDLVWEPKGDQAERFKEAPIRPVLDDILIAKLRPGQEVDMELHCHKGVGQEHAKWSPVGTASYRILPEITILKPITGDDAYKFQKCFPEGVVDVVEENGEKIAKVVNARKDTVSREVLRHKEFENKVRLTRVRDHFIFKVESTGIYPPEELFGLAVNVLMEKIKAIQPALERATSNEIA
ncbi:RNA polymerase I 140 kDa subunit [Radiomyces spectabilis]|uniref:RNA polymerase I 140 kDa subunit n=1 Tax=Radiomyces spectabilis TaxID=64574 RepID=UPI002220F4CE|nr:RNA polymerase I 140 kDa subunit [Radiomyces spectabilis]KAI8393375.1 RNA polymerase I 140 kDa subunit [Radiomyces spectabilis]